MKITRPAVAVLALLAAGAPLSSAQILEPAKFSPAGPGERREGDPSVAAAHAAAARLRSGASEASVRIGSVPVEFARVLTVTGYAGEVPAGLAKDPGAALKYKESYWSAQREALQRRLAQIGAEEREERAGTRARLDGLGASGFDFRLGLEESCRSGAALARLSSERLRLEADLRRVNAVLDDVKADRDGSDGPDQMLKRKAALMRSIAES